MISYLITTTGRQTALSRIWRRAQDYAARMYARDDGFTQGRKGMTTADAADTLDVSRRYVQRLCAAGRLVSEFRADPKTGRRVRDVQWASVRKLERERLRKMVAE